MFIKNHIKLGNTKIQRRGVGGGGRMGVLIFLIEPHIGAGGKVNGIQNYDSGQLI